jgi:hypothetical protein
MRHAAAVLACLALATGRADAYEFWLRAETIAQLYDVRDYQVMGPDVLLSRQRFTQTLALRITDIGDLAAHRRRDHRRARGLAISFHTYLRIDHDFGGYTAGSIVVPDPIAIAYRAPAVIPELGASVAHMDLLYGYVEIAGLFDDRATIQLGRIFTDDGWGATAYDGAAVRALVPGAPLAVVASGGLRVRASSPFGVAAYELDGTSGAACMQYIAGPTPGTGAWQLIDRNRIGPNLALSADLYRCPQRDVAQPTVGFAIATTLGRRFGAELGYRRTWSDTVTSFGPINGVTFASLYPSDIGALPATGIDEERVWARVHGELCVGPLVVTPYADLRYSILHAAVDRADAGVRVRAGDHVVEPSVEYFYPTFDGDSIFNAFSIEPTVDGRLQYRYAPTGAWRALASAWLRRYAHEDGADSFAGGGDAGVERALGRDAALRGSALYDDGYGGRRAGGTLDATWRPHRDVWLRGRAVVLAVREDDRAIGPTAFVTSSGVARATWRVADTAALHGLVEIDHDAIHSTQARGLAVLDLAFLPEQ